MKVWRCVRGALSWERRGTDRSEDQINGIPVNTHAVLATIEATVALVDSQFFDIVVEGFGLNVMKPGYVYFRGNESKQIPKSINSGCPASGKGHD